MNLLYIHQYFKFPDQNGGTRSYDLASSFVKNGIQVSVISSNTESSVNSKSRWMEYERDGIHFYMLNCRYDNSMTVFQRIKAFILFMYYTSFKVMKVNCDVVLATSTPLTIAIPALIRKWIKSTPFIFEIRDVWPEVPIRMGFIKNRFCVKALYWFEKLVYRNAAWLVPLSTGMNENIQKRYPNHKFTVIPNISELERFQKKGEAVSFPIDIEGKKMVLYAGTFGDVNGLDYLVDLASYTMQIDDSICYFVYGNGKTKESVLKYAAEKKVLNKVFFYCGTVAKAQLSYLYSKSMMGSSFVIDNPVLWDNSANKFFDTLAACKPILINHKGWQEQVIADENIGYVLPAKITIEGAVEFVTYINNRTLIEEQGKNAFQLAKREYSLEIAVNRYLHIFKKIV